MYWFMYVSWIYLTLLQVPRTTAAATATRPPSPPKPKAPYMPPTTKPLAPLTPLKQYPRPRPESEETLSDDGMVIDEDGDDDVIGELH